MKKATTVTFVSFRFQQANFSSVGVLYNRTAPVEVIERKVTDDRYNDEQYEKGGEAGPQFFADGKVPEKISQHQKGP